MVLNKQITVQIKGVQDGLLISLADGEWEEQLDALMTYIHEREGFFKGAKVAVDVGSQVLHAAEVGTLRDKLSDEGVVLWAIVGQSGVTAKNASVMGLETRLNSPKTEKQVKPLDTSLIGEPAVLVHRTLRSGFKISHPGHVIVIGDVNPGAEIIAGGNVVVWGKLRGLVHAGAEGDQNAIVCALGLMPTQLRIAEQIAIQPQRRGKPQPEVARIDNGQVIAEPWNFKEGEK
jgi:septum site-determining protein MinC